jgi:LemA protein
MITFVALGILAAVVLGYSVMIYNNLIASKNDVDRAWSNIDVLLKQRHDELPKLLKIVESYMQYEQDTLTRIIKARSQYANATTPGDQMKANQALHQGLVGLFALAENYPELKSNTQFQDLQRRISQIETSIADRREFYNASVNNWNTSIEQVPEVAYAKLMLFKRRELFEVSAEDRKDVAMDIKIPKAG